MEKIRRNDPCPCGSGKKYKQCCLKAEEKVVVNDRSEGVPKAIDWLQKKYRAAVLQAIEHGFFGTLNDQEFATLKKKYAHSFEDILINAMEWLLADGFIRVNNRERRVASLLLDHGGPLFSAEQRQWIELLTSTPLRLYEIVEVQQGQSLLLKDLIEPECQPILVREKLGSQQVRPHDILGARILPVEDHFELSGAMYSIPCNQCWSLLEQLRVELQGVELDSVLAKQITSDIIPDYWLQLFVDTFEIPKIVDHVTGEALLFVTDHYQVQDWDALVRVLSEAADIEGNREDGWNRLFEGEDGLQRSNMSINISKRSNRIEVFYHTQTLANEGRLWFEILAGAALTFITREISDPKGMLTNSQPHEHKQSSLPTEFPLELNEMLEQRIRQIYSDWADLPIPALGDKTPRVAIQTAKGLEQVKFLLYNYEQEESEQAKIQGRNPISYDFLWQSIGITR